MERENSSFRQSAYNYYKSVGIVVPPFSIEGLEAYARVLDIYDGDTIQVALNVGGRCNRYNVRMQGIDTCEMKSKNDMIKKRSIKARNTLLSLITGDDTIDLYENFKRQSIRDRLKKDVYLVYLECGQFEKYGRLLAHISLTEDSTMTLANILIERKLGYRYYGGAKLSEEQQIKIIDLIPKDDQE
jgi:endonuclease YncB( thermonuclease family)